MGDPASVASVIPAAAAAAAAALPVSVPTAAGGSPAAFAAPVPATPDPPAPAQQLVSVLTPFRTASDGTHQITLRLKPEGLGNVDATVTIMGRHVIVELNVENGAAKQAIAAALPELRHELGGGDGNAATVLFANGEPGGRPRGNGSNPAGASSTRGDEPVAMRFFAPPPPVRARPGRRSICVCKELSRRVLGNPTAASGASAAAASTQTATGLNQLDNSQTFLQLLVAQLQNQDPDNPTDPTSFMTEIAQLTAVQSQTSLNAEEQTVAADSMLDRTVARTGTNGQSLSGTVTGVLLASLGAPPC